MTCFPLTWSKNQDWPSSCLYCFYPSSSTSELQTFCGHGKVCCMPENKLWTLARPKKDVSFKIFQGILFTPHTLWCARRCSAHVHSLRFRTDLRVSSDLPSTNGTPGSNSPGHGVQVANLSRRVGRVASSRVPKGDCSAEGGARLGWPWGLVDSFKEAVRRRVF